MFAVFSSIIVGISIAISFALRTALFKLILLVIAIS